MDSRVRELLERSFAGQTRPEAVARYLAQAEGGPAVAPGVLEDLVVAVLERDQAAVAEDQRHAAERQQADLQTENLLQLLGAILESSDEGIIALDEEDRILRFNSQFVSLFRIPDEVMAFWHHDQVMAAVLAQLAAPEAFRGSLAALCADPLAKRREMLECVDGRMIEWRSQPQPAVWGGVKRVVSFLDVSERFRAETNRRLLESKLDETRHRLLEAEKLAAIFQLSAGLAHEISNPIGFIHSNLETLGRYVQGMVGLLKLYGQAAGAGGDDALGQRIAAEKQALDLDFMLDDAQDLLAESLAGTRRLATMVGSLRVLAHARGGAMQAADLRTLLEAGLAKVEVAPGEGIRLLPVFGDIPAVECRPSELAEAFKNLLTNAVEAVDGAGSIGIRTGADGAEAWVDITDSGRGIPPENLDRVFEPFFTTKPPGAGMGLGLSVAYAIVAMHGGRITVSSEPGKGSRFRVVLPLRQPRSG